METPDVISNKHLNDGQMTVIVRPLCIHTTQYCCSHVENNTASNKEKQMCEHLDIYLPVFY